MAAAASLCCGIGAPEHEYKKIALWLSAFRLICNSLRTGLAAKDKMLALKLFGGITLFFGLALRSLLASPEWNQSGSIFACMLIISWAGVMAMAASTGFENAWEHFKEGFFDARSQWRLRDPARTAANEHWHMSCEASQPQASASLPTRKRL